MCLNMTEQWVKTSLTLLKTLWGQQPGGNHQLLGKKSVFLDQLVADTNISTNTADMCSQGFQQGVVKLWMMQNEINSNMLGAAVSHSVYLEGCFLVFIAVSLLSNLFADNLASFIQTKWDHDIMIATNAVKLLVQHPIYELFHPTKARSPQQQLTIKSGNTQCDWCLPEVTDCSLDLRPK